MNSRNVPNRIFTEVIIDHIPGIVPATRRTVNSARSWHVITSQKGDPVMLQCCRKNAQRGGCW